MDVISPLFIVSVFTAGVISFFAPCIIPLLPVYVSVLSGNSGTGAEIDSDRVNTGIKFNWKLVAQTLVFVAGLGTTFVLLGFGAGALGRLFASRPFLIGCGVVVIILGLHQTGIFRLLFLNTEKKLEIGQNQKSGTLSSYLLGLSFSFGWTPCVGPVLATVIAVASNGSQVLYGVVLMLVYTLGLAIPFLLVSFFTEYLLNAFKKMNQHIPKIRVAGGILIIVMGVALMTDNLNLISGVFIRR